SINAPIYYSIPQGSEQPAVISYSGLEELPDNYPGDAKSWMGTPIVFPVTFKGDNIYQRYKDNGEMEKNVSMSDFMLPAATMFSFRRAKNIERTNLLGSNGTVKEIFGFDDWIIDVKGICLDEPNRPAHEQYKQLLEWESLACSFGISGHLFNQKKIDVVTLYDWNDNVVQGKPGTIPFSFQLY